MEKEKNLVKERILSNLFWLLFFILVFSFFIHYYNIVKYKENTYRGLLNYYYNEKKQNWETIYYIKGQKYIIPFYSNPKEFENYRVLGRDFNKNPNYIFLVFKNDSNYSIITTAFFNLARILNPKGYYSFVYLYPAELRDNKYIVISLNKDSSKKVEGFLDCDMRDALFIVIDDKKESSIILKDSCIFVNGKKEEVLKGVDMLSVILLKKLEEKK